MHVLVTGATGHLGANLVRALLGGGHRVRALVYGAPVGLEGLALERVPGDVLDPATLRPAFDGVEVVYHLAARISISGDHGGLVTRTNVHGVRHVAEAALAARVRRMVHVSSIHAFALDTPITIDERSPRATDPLREPAYNLSKYAGELTLRRVIDRGLDATIVNPTAIMGPFDYLPSRLGRTLIQLYRRTLPALTPGAFDFVDVRDVARSVIAATDRGRTGENYILGGRTYDLDAFARIVHQVTRRPGPPLNVPMPLARVVAPLFELGGRLTGTEPLYTRESLLALRTTAEVCHDKATRELGHDPRPFVETIRDAYVWFARAGMIRADPAEFAGA